MKSDGSVTMIECHHCHKMTNVPSNMRCIHCGGGLDKESTPIEKVNHPPHYGGADNPYEAIKVIEAWKLGFNLGNTVKYISRADHKEDRLHDLKKARWYLDREISNMEKPNA